jgi:hypothetical protein
MPVMPTLIQLHSSSNSMEAKQNEAFFMGQSLNEEALEFLSCVLT